MSGVKSQSPGGQDIGNFRIADHQRFRGFCLIEVQNILESFCAGFNILQLLAFRQGQLAGIAEGKTFFRREEVDYTDLSQNAVTDFGVVRSVQENRKICCYFPDCLDCPSIKMDMFLNINGTIDFVFKIIEADIVIVQQGQRGGGRSADYFPKFRFSMQKLALNIC